MMKHRTYSGKILYCDTVGEREREWLTATVRGNGDRTMLETTDDYVELTP